MIPTSEAVRRVPTGPARRGPIGQEPARVTAGQPGLDKGAVTRSGREVHIDAGGVYYKTLNGQVREEVMHGAATVVLDRVNGQRYIGAGIDGAHVELVVNGVPGNDLATFMNGPTVVVNENAQDAIGNTMNDGLVIVHGDAGDVLGYGMRGGTLYVRGDVGYRVGIHMKAYQNQTPVLVVGGAARDYLGEYMAGGELLVLGVGCEEGTATGSYIGTGMHGGVIYVRGEVDPHQMGKEVGESPLLPGEGERLETLVRDFCLHTGIEAEEVLKKPFTKLVPVTHRPYGKLYAH